MAFSPTRSSILAGSKGALQYAVGLGLLTHVVWKHWNTKGGVPGLRDLLHQERDMLMLLLASACIVLATALQFSRWFLLVRGAGLPFAMSGAVRLGLVGLFYNTFLPGSVGGDAVKAFLLSRENPDQRPAALASVIADRMFGLFSLLLFVAVVGSAFWFGGNGAIARNLDIQRIIISCDGIATAAVFGWLVVGFWSNGKSDHVLERLERVPKIGRSLAAFWSAWWTYRRRPKLITACLALSLLNHLLYVLVFHFAAGVFSRTTASLPEHLAAVPIAYAIEGFFPAPGGVGGGEAIFGYLYRILDRPEIVGISGKLAMRLAQWAIGAAGFIAYLRLKAQLQTRSATE